MAGSSLLTLSQNAGLAPQGDIHTQFAIKRLQKLGRQPRQVPGRVTPPPKLVIPKGS